MITNRIVRIALEFDTTTDMVSYPLQLVGHPHAEVGSRLQGVRQPEGDAVLTCSGTDLHQVL
eukprot:1704406-Amphidinium_carterae.1